ncbi:hypothetical protein P7C71_g938, partial [Lecanoromycetidae sp. Uapishka_2]
MVAAASLMQSVLGITSSLTNLTALFGPSLSPDAQIILPSDVNFSERLTQRWTNYNAPSYIGAIKPATEADIQNTVKIAAANNIPFFTTGGGHGIADYHIFNGLSIDLSNFRTVQLDPSENLLTVGGSAKIWQLNKLLYDAGKEFPLGSCACMGVVGATMGAGIASMHGHRGLMLDALQSVRVITADGRALDASKTQHSDLFWALRGAGSNFGIVTSATYKVYDASNNRQTMNADFVFSASANHTFWEIMKTFDYTLPSRLALTAVAFYDRVNRQPVIALNAVFFGTLEEGEQYLSPFKTLNPVRSNISMVAGIDLMDAAFFNFFGNDNGACTPNQHINIYTVALKQIDPPTFQLFFADITSFWEANPDFQGRLLMQRFPNDAVQAVPDEETAYAYRDVKTYMNIEGFYTDKGLDDAANAFMRPARDSFAKTSGFGTLATYSNYAHGDEGPEAWYSARKLPQLSALKRKWDPDRLFSWNSPVPVQWP